MMPDADGFKTGSLRQAGWNHSTTAERDGRRIIAVVMNTSSRSARQTESRRLLNFGFDELRRRETMRTENTRIFHDGRLIPLETMPKIHQGILLLPVEDIMEHLGHSTDWDKEHGIVSINHDNGHNATLMINRDLAVINGETLTLLMPAQVIDGKIFTSVESLGFITGTAAEWNPETCVIRLK